MVNFIGKILKAASLCNTNLSKYRFIKSIFLVFVLLPGFISLAQEPLTRKISFLEGLPSEVIYDLFVDRQGLLYLGTDKGLITFDGVHFEQIQCKANLGNSINSLQQDAEGMVWCKNFANQVFFMQNNVLVEDAPVKRLLAQHGANLVDFTIAPEQMWVVTQYSIFSLSEGDSPKLVYELDSEDSSGFLSTTYDKVSGKLHVSTANAVLTFSNSKLIETQKAINGLKILEMHQGQLCYNFKSMNNGCVIGNKNLVMPPDLKDTYLNKLSSAANVLWLCSNNGLYEIDVPNKKVKPGILINSRISDVVVDLEGNSWISTLDEGLYMMPDKRIISFNPDKDIIGITNFTKIAKGANGNYFVGTSNGRVVEINAAGKIILVYDTNSDNTVEFVSISGNILMTSYGFFKIGNPKMTTPLTYLGKGLAEDEKGNLLMASSHFAGLFPKDFVGSPHVEKPLSKYEIIKHGKEDINIMVLRNKRARSVLYDKFEKKYYVSYIDGLFVYDNFGNETHIRFSGDREIIASEMLQTDDGSIWIASFQTGVFRLKGQKILQHISTKQGLSGDNCRRIEIDKQGLWIVTDVGFDFYDFKTKEVTNAGLNLCIKGMTINDVYVEENKVALATNQGIYSFDKRVTAQVTFPKFRVTNFLVNGKDVPIDKEITLKHDQNNININFKTIHFKSLGNYDYEYRLIGLDDKWYSQDASTKNINYLALNPGDYHFQIKVKLGDQYTQLYGIRFVIQKPFWIQYWFMVTALLALLALLFLVYRWAEIKTKKSEELKEQLAVSQLTALRSQMNPHFMFNILNAVQGLIYSNQKSRATEYLGKFSDLMRKILDTSDKNEVTIEKEFETLDLYISLEKARFEDDFEYRISFPPNVDLARYKIPSMIIQPFVENAIKHGLMHKPGFKKLDIKVEFLNDVWCFTIDDNGIGRKASEIINQKIKKHISFATKAIESRVKLINKTTNITIDIEIIDKKSKLEEPLGTRIKIYIPIKED